MSDPFHIIAPTSETPLFLFGDHASRHIPHRFADLGLNGDDLTRHIAWDIGTAGLIEGVCETMGCGGVLAGFSRLLIDPNRSLRMDSLVPTESDGTIIPGNADLTAEARQDRIDTLYKPYHAALSAQISRAGQPLVVSVHSFTPKPDTGAQRTLDLGLLVKHDTATADRFIEILAAQAPHLSVAINEPYSAHDLNHTIDRHVAPRALPHLAIEIRQDHIGTKAGEARFVRIMSDALRALMES